ncbi:MAG: endonuclease/exonuclease/phosphatase family protein, partial [Paludibacter sp.]|nr:endonuclease/exonuclease/phosphatase family protein [Paludibacter sp.]
MKKINSKFIIFFTAFLCCIHLFEIQGKTLQLKVTTLNTEWLSCPTFGPEDDELQVNNIASIIRTMKPDIIVLQEVGTSADYATIDTLLSKLGNEWGGSITPNSYDNCGQYLGIIYREPKIQLVSSSVLSSGISSHGNRYYYNWSAGRYPLLYNIIIVDGNTQIPLSVINIHAKAMSDETSYTRRKGASEALKTILDGNAFNTKNIVLLGDFNDYLIES